MNRTKTRSNPGPQAISRREFIRATSQTAALAATAVAFPHVSRGRVLGANDRIGVGFIGVGGRGSSHLATVQRLAKEGERVQVIAVNDVFRYRLN